MCRFVEKKEKSIVFSTLSNPPYYSNSPIINNYYNVHPTSPLIIPTSPIIRDSRVLDLPYSNGNAGNSILWFQLQSYKNETDFRCI